MELYSLGTGNAGTIKTGASFARTYLKQESGFWGNMLQRNLLKQPG